MFWQKLNDLLLLIQGSPCMTPQSGEEQFVADDRCNFARSLACKNLQALVDKDE